MSRESSIGEGLQPGPQKIESTTNEQVGNQAGIFERVIEVLQHCPEETASRASSADLAYLRDLDRRYSGDHAQLVSLSRKLEERLVAKRPNFVLAPSFEVESYGSIEVARKAVNLDREELLREYQQRFSEVFEALRKRIMDGMRIEEGGIKSVGATKRRIDQATKGRTPRVPDFFRLRVVFDGLKSLDDFYNELLEMMFAGGLKCVGCRNKYNPSKKMDIIDSQGKILERIDLRIRNFRTISTEWVSKNDQAVLANLPTEIQLVTEGMHLASMITHPFREFSRNVNWEDVAGPEQVEQVKEWVTNLILKAGIADIENFLKE